MSKLVIVESPAKAKTIKKYLGKGYEVMASMGHIRDLPQNSLGVNVDKEFRPQYLNISGKEKLIKELQAAAKGSDGVLLATDPDREGEAISWHLAHILKLPIDEKNRVTFGEITQKGIEAGMSAPRTIDLDLVNSQQARRVLDRIVGYKLSPFLWRKVRRGLSAGRVQSVAVRLIVDREREIEAFVPEEFWTIDAVLKASGSQKTFTARLRTKEGISPEDFKIKNESEASAILREIENEKYVISDIKRGTRKRAPEPPFITSTLQQEASKRLNFTARRTMRAAQELYEGIDVEGYGSIGLITYMRTDSLRVADDAVAAANNYIVGEYGEKYVCRYARTYKRKNASTVQDAHEAIRPTVTELTPEQVKKSLSTDQYKLYKLIWERFIASRMSDQVLSTMVVGINAGDYRFRANGHSVEFDGFTKLYEVAEEKSESYTDLPALTETSELSKKELKPAQRFTQPPMRFTEATL
ncbi:MAG: type I DNA topoisomerase, partial [Ruminococcaceae bacterium]|nr:type I DNA topoisomerase [Oscillospiraceae bacterium]